MTLILQLLTVTLLMAVLAAVGFYFTDGMSRILAHYQENSFCMEEGSSAPVLQSEKNHENDNQQNK